MCVHRGSEGCVFRCVGMKLTKYSLLLQETQTNPVFSRSLICRNAGNACHFVIHSLSLTM